MQLILNEHNEIQSFVLLGNIEDSTEFTGVIPDDFESQFKPSFYLLQNNEIVVNLDYEEPAFELPETSTGPTTEQVMINQLGLKVAELTNTVKKLGGGEANV